MKVKLLLLLFTLVFVSCDAMPPADIELIGKDGYATYQASNALLTVTAASADRDRARATQVALATRDASEAEVQALAARAVGTQTAVSSVLTVAAVTQVYEAAATKGAIEATMFPYTITPLAATQQAIQNRVSTDRIVSRVKVIAWALWFWVLLPGLLFYLTTKVIGMFQSRTPPVPEVYEPEVVPPVIQDVVEWVKLSIMQHGEHSNRLLGYRKVPAWGSAKWQGVKGWAEAEGFVRSDATGTFVSGDYTLGWLLNELQRAYDLLPYPAA